MPFKTIKCLSISLVAHKVGGFSLFHLLFGVVSGSFQPVLACYGLYRVFPPFTNDGITCFCLANFIYNKKGQVLLQSGTAFLYHKSRASGITKEGITRWGKFCNKVEAGITESGNFYYNVG